MAPNELLQGVRLLDFAAVGPAARASRWLADYGAEVIKVGAVPKHGGVQITPPSYAYAGHRRMRRALFDLKSSGGLAAFVKLATTADIILESFRPGVMERLGIGYGDLRKVNEDLVYCSTSGYGQTGPRSDWAGHDLNYLAVSGFLSTGTPRADGGPSLPGATVADVAGGGMQAAMSILAALVQRERTGEGAFLDVSVADGMLSMMSLYADEYLATGEIPGPGHNILTGRYACYDVYECSDGEWVTVAAIEPAFWANLCRELGLEEFTESQLDDEAQTKIRQTMATVFRTRPVTDWVDELGPRDCCVAPVLTVPEALEDEQFVARKAIRQAITGGDDKHAVQQVGPLLAGQNELGDVEQLPDWSATSTKELLEEAGVPTSKIKGLAISGAIA